MFRKWKQHRLQRKINQSTRPSTHSFEELLKTCRLSSDFEIYQLSKNSPITLYYYASVIKPEILHDEILPALQQVNQLSLEELRQAISIENNEIIEAVEDLMDGLMRGSVIIHSTQTPKQFLLVPAEHIENRSVSLPEVEFSVVGPKEAFVEPLQTNLNLIRKRIPIPELVVKEYTIGDLSKSKTAILYLHGIANEQVVHTLTQRITDIQFDQIVDSSFVAQLIADDSNSVFPQLIDTERPDRVASLLAEGKVAVILDGSPHALTGPTSFVEFFSAFEDYFLPWPIASIFRLIRLFAILFSVLSTALYVAVLTYHYEMIPTTLLNTLVSSRSGIPFPPVFEALILELVIELLREAGARLPAKIGQTIGIVGGIVIGTAAVDAGLTSNILLIIVALTGLASFTTPIYQMGNTIRLIRFPFILAAQWLGFLGVAACFALFLSHLLALTSLGHPYLVPIYPLRVADLKDSFFRLPFRLQTKRPQSIRAQKQNRFNKPNEKNHLIQPDIEE
ncbi:spore germination protein [Alkalicoccobacillus porphyridii]|uniref:spore germination protein n=1 Tax=Alkalicoccobacillus porphyridii TaxID=2597270 RepID=UPI0021B0E4F0|nr:spore germination protein [Alkalicoccobacillus porphyridii]